MSKKKKAKSKKAVVETVAPVVKKAVTLECINGHRWSSAEGDWCPKCLERGRPVKVE